jgi:hypothetical protein
MRLRSVLVRLICLIVAGAVALQVVLLVCEFASSNLRKPSSSAESVSVRRLKTLGLAVAEYWYSYGVVADGSLDPLSQGDSWMPLLAKFAQEAHFPCEFTFKNQDGSDGYYARLTNTGKVGETANELPFVLLELKGLGKGDAKIVDAARLKEETQDGAWSRLNVAGDRVRVLMVERPRKGHKAERQTVFVQRLTHDQFVDLLSRFVVSK